MNPITIVMNDWGERLEEEKKFIELKKKNERQVLVADLTKINWTKCIKLPGNSIWYLPFVAHLFGITCVRAMHIYLNNKRNNHSWDCWTVIDDLIWSGVFEWRYQFGLVDLTLLIYHFDKHKENCIWVYRNKIMGYWFFWHSLSYSCNKISKISLHFSIVAVVFCCFFFIYCWYFWLNAAFI